MSPQNAPLPQLDERQRYSVPEAIAYLRTSRRSIYALIGSGSLRVLKEGRRTYVPGSEIARLSRVPT